MHGLLNLFRLLLIANPGRSENQRVLREQLHWLARIVFLSSLLASLEVCCERLGTVLIFPERFVSVWDRLGIVRSILGMFGSV